MIDFDLMMQKQEELRRRKRAAESLRERATDTSVHFTDTPGRGSGNSQERIRLEMIAAEEAACETEKELAEMKRQLRRAMRRLRKWQHIDAIRKRYMEGKQIARVAEEIGYEARQTKRFISEAKRIINRI